MRADDITRALGDVGHKWTRQVKAEEKSFSARSYRQSMWTVSRTSLKDICYAHMPEAWNQASDNGRLPTHWRQVFYVMRPLCDAHPESDRPLRDATFKVILEDYLADYRPGWDVLRGARGAFKEPHSAINDNGLPMSTMGVRGYLQAAAKTPNARLAEIPSRFPTKGAVNRIAAVLICEKEGFDELLQQERIPEEYDLALMSTKGISAVAARDLAGDLDIPCFTLHDMDKNGFVMAAGFPFATDIGIRLEDVEKWDLAPEEQHHRNPLKTKQNLLRNGATVAEADFVAAGQRVELNMLTSPQFIEFVKGKLEAHGVEKVIPDDETLEAAWKRAHAAIAVNKLIASTWDDDAEASPETDPAEPFLQKLPPAPDDLAARIREAFDDDPVQSWDDALWTIAAAHHKDGES